MEKCFSKQWTVVPRPFAWGQDWGFLMHPNTGKWCQRRRGQRLGEASGQIILSYVISWSELVRESTQDSLNACLSVRAEIILLSSSKGLQCTFQSKCREHNSLVHPWVCQLNRCVCGNRSCMKEANWVSPSGTDPSAVLVNAAWQVGPCWLSNWDSLMEFPAASTVVLPRPLTQAVAAGELSSCCSALIHS